ncbi:hypothetical protein SBOR_3799 [Sclerotinia borealis F-4128]|uniref:Uncharacterized protein n=1 Tax=Sclerotinia borealis (strain F-4128) TaxID=1432307 RepID=W9CGC3_SCLBF|nr:hypothetical protein SBOR_3799 [Sclerotinia borealis F-4128]
MPRKRNKRQVPSRLSHVEFAYEEPSPKPQSVAITSHQSEYPDSEEVGLTKSGNRPLDDHQRLQGPFDEHSENDGASSNTIDVRRDSKNTEDLANHTQIPQIVPTITDGKSPLDELVGDHFTELHPLPLPLSHVEDESQARQQEESNVHSMERSRSYLSQGDSCHVEYDSHSPAQPKSIDRTLPVDKRIPSLRIIYQRGDRPLAYKRVKSFLKQEDKAREQHIREAYDNFPPGGSFNRRALPSIPRLIRKYILSDDIPLHHKLPIPRYDSRGKLLDDQPPCPADVNSRSRSYSDALLSYDGWVSPEREATQDEMRTIINYRNRSPRAPARSRKTVSHRAPTPHKNSDPWQFLAKVRNKFCRVRKSRTRAPRKPLVEIPGPHCYKLLKSGSTRKIDRMYSARLSTCTKQKSNPNSVFRSLNSSHSNIKVDFRTCSTFGSDSVNNSNEAKYDDNNDDLDTLMSSSLASSSSDLLPEDDGHMTSTERFDLLKIPGAYPSSCPESSPEIATHMDSKLCKPKHLDGVNNPSAHKDFVSDMRQLGERRVCRKHIDISNNPNSSVNNNPDTKPQIKKLLLDRAQGITDNNKPDPSKRLLSTIRVQNDSPEQSRARKRRRREIIRDDDSSEDDFEEVEGPRKIVRLYHKGITDESKACEPLTKENVKELVSREEATNYPGILKKDTIGIPWTKRVRFEFDGEIYPASGPHSDEMDIDDSQNDSEIIQSRSTSSAIRPCLTRGTPLSIGGVAMSRGGPEKKEFTARRSRFKDSVLSLRRLQKKACQIRNEFRNGTMLTVLLSLKGILKDIRNEAICVEAPADYFRKQRAARIIVDIIKINTMVNRDEGDDGTDLSGWYDHDDFNATQELKDLQAEVDELEMEIMSCEDEKELELKMSKQSMLEAQIEEFEVIEEWYNAEVCDDDSWSDFATEGKCSMDVKMQALGAQASALGIPCDKFQEVTSDEDDELDENMRRAIALSLAESGGEDREPYDDEC